ncbi:MAG: hypothetical protein J0L51_00065 [Rhizobiales bacterium]|nr:hypothetical protein [Hyphomicrobiales bacterium]
MRIKTEQLSLSAGEISPELHARRDLARHAAAARRIENGIVLAEGVVTKAPGTRFVAEARESLAAGMMIGVEGRDGSDSVAAVLLGDFVRFYKDTGVIVQSAGSTTPYELALPTAYRGTDLSVLRWAQSNDVLFLCGVGRPQTLSRFSDTDWRFADYDNLRGPVRKINTTATTILASDVTGTVNLTASADLFVEGHIGSLWRLDDADLSAVPAWIALESVSAGARRRNRGLVYEALNGASTGPNAPTHTEGDVSSGNAQVTWRYIDNGKGYVRITAVTGPRNAVAVVTQRLPATVATGSGTTRWHEAAWSNAPDVGWPDRVMIFDQKICWCRGDEIWITRAGDFYDFDVDDTDLSAIPLRVTPQGGGSGTSRIKIEWVLGAGILVIGGSTGEYVMRGAGAADAITITNVKVLPDNSNGSSAHRPAIAERGAIFIGKDKRRIYYAAFDRLAETVDADDITLFARHILKGDAVDLAYQRDPNRLLFVRLANGQLRVLTFNPKQEVIGWARRLFSGDFVESMAVIPGPKSSMQLWLLVRREIGGLTRRYVEVMQPFFEAGQDDERAQDATGAWFVDAGLSTTFPAPVSTLKVPHLAGRSVRIFADGGDRGLATADAEGNIGLDRTAREVLVGLPLTLRILPLPFEARLQTGPTGGKLKAATHASIDLTASAGGKVRIGADDNPGLFEPLHPTGSGRIGQPVALQHGSIRVPVESGSGRELLAEIVHEEALPFTFAGIAPALDIEGGA